MPIPGDVDPISPELALVDDRLGDLGRRELPDAPDTLSSLERVEARRAARSERARRARRARVAGLVGVAAALLVASAAGLALTLDDGSGPVPATVERSSSDIQKPAGKNGPSIELRWRRVPGARFYNVILWRNGVRAIDLWPRAPSVRIPKAKLEPGVYQWFVYPSLGDGGAQRYGKVAARGTIRV